MRVAVIAANFRKSSELMTALRQLPVQVYGDPDDIFQDEQQICAFLNQHRAEIAIIGREPITASLLSSCPQLTLIAKYGVGVDNVDFAALRRYGVVLACTPGVNRRSVAELALGFMLGHCHRLFVQQRWLANGIWRKDGGCDLASRRVGIIGLGAVGSELARLLRAFSCQVFYHDILDRSGVAQQLGLISMPYQELLQSCDVLSFHVPLTSETRGMYGAEQIARTPPHALVINTCRGEVVDFDAVVNAVRSNQLAGYAADVFEQEPCELSRFAQTEGLYFTPHIGGSSRDAITAMGNATIAKIREYVQGKREG